MPMANQRGMLRGVKHHSDGGNSQLDLSVHIVWTVEIFTQ